MRGRSVVLTGGVALLAAALTAGSLAGPAAAATPAKSDFFAWSGAAPLESYAPGTVLKTRKVSYHVLGIALPLSVTQLVYRSNDAGGRAIAAVTSVIAPPGKAKGPVIAYESAYDSLRAATHAGVVGRTSKIGVIGYSGGAIGTTWTAALAPSYAPDVDERLVGAAEGGVLVNPAPTASRSTPTCARGAVRSSRS